ncbi:hypothetical protein [Methanolacinia petrolearia]|uniref:hypothetical protein n=1 Tax=Methanolacinia petrolearia TaxID=54120 RepID=UPI003BA9A3B0
MKGKGLKKSSWNVCGLVLAVAGICCIIAATQAGVLVYSSQETQDIVESPVIPYDQKKAVLYVDALQTNNSAVLGYALLRTMAVDPDGDTLQYACDIWDDLNSNWKVVSDPLGPEYISSSLESIKADLRGDCDDYSVLMAGLAGSVGAEMRVVNVAGTGGNPGHAFPEYYLGTNEDEVIGQCRYISARYDCERVYYSHNGQSGETACWLNFDWSVGRNPDMGYYVYGDTSNYHELVHPGESYYGVGQQAVFYYPDGTYASDTPGHGYYEEDVFGKEALYEIQL